MWQALQRSAVSRLCPRQGHFYQEWHRLPPRSWGKGKTSLSAKTKFFIIKMLHFLLMNDVIGCLQGSAKWEASEPSWRHWPVSGAGDQTQLLWVCFLSHQICSSDVLVADRHQRCWEARAPESGVFQDTNALGTHRWHFWKQMTGSN